MKRTLAATTIALGVGALLAGASTASYAGVTEQDILNDAKTTHQIVTNGMGTQGQRYSPLKKINTDTVSKLVPAWSFSMGGEKQRGLEAQPIIYDGVMYITGSYSRLFAIDIKTGHEIWEYNARLAEGMMPCCDVINRGAAIYGDMVYFGTLDAKLIALDRKTGKVIWKKKLGDYKAGYSYSAAPLIVKGKIITGVSGGEFGIVGRVDARDAITGDLVWSRPVIEGHMGTLNGKPSTMTGVKNATWPGDMWKSGGGATWLGGTYDQETDLLFFGTGNPAPWNSHLRKGDNLYAASRLAINPDNGEIVWHYQTTPRESWDYDGVNEVISYNLDGKKLAATADRNGFFYVLDRTNGKLQNATPFVDKISWAKGIDLKTGRPIFDPANRPGDPAKGDGKKGTQIFAVPAFLGGKNQMPMAYSPDTSLFYVPANQWGMDLWNEPTTYKKGAAYLGAGFTMKPLYDTHVGELKAIDPRTGKIVWQYNNKAPLWGGVLTTGGNLVFTGTPEGYLKAFDAKTGKELWKFNTGSGVVAPPVTWEMDGEQYVAVGSGWGGAVPLWGGEVAKLVKNFNQGGSVWVFKLSH
ncbi:MAG: PQQ-dependent methanol/ethanol family dehydrogenase [Alphaproteobacteria bacterium]|nr:PQQ-dependent methanol/ethanol family dehydrogenase [Rhodospirillales bacterium]MCW9045451.1 PQQ-dependent methanol/ethanol family dehydrogenase [Alphaproteobacteria bacterium]